MGDTVTTTTSSSRSSLNERTETAPMGSEERSLLEQMRQYLGQAMGAVTLGGRAGGNDGLISGKIRDLVASLVNPQADTARAGVEADYAQAGAALSGALEGAGLGGSSIEAVRRAVQGTDKARSLADIERDRASQIAGLTLHYGQQDTQNQLARNQMLMDTILGVGNALSSNYLNTRLANTSSSRTESGSRTDRTTSPNQMLAQLLSRV